MAGETRQSYERELGEIHATLASINAKLDNMICNVNKNTEFRQNAQGALGLAVTIGMLAGGFFLWAAQKLFNR